MNLAVHPTPCGPFTILADDDGAVLAAGWTAHPGTDPVFARANPGSVPVFARAEVGAASRAVRAYFAGELAAIDEVVVRQSSGPVVEAGWAQLRAIRPGATITYAELAARVGRPGAARAASGACSRNAAALFVPCHRVVRSTGALGGFRWGLEVKRALLAHEARHAAGR